MSAPLKCPRCGAYANGPAWYVITPHGTIKCRARTHRDNREVKPKARAK